MERASIVGDIGFEYPLYRRVAGVPVYRYPPISSLARLMEEAARLAGSYKRARSALRPLAKCFIRRLSLRTLYPVPVEVGGEAELELEYLKQEYANIAVRALSEPSLVSRLWSGGELRRAGAINMSLYRRSVRSGPPYCVNFQAKTTEDALSVLEALVEGGVEVESAMVLSTMWTGKLAEELNLYRLVSTGVLIPGPRSPPFYKLILDDATILIYNTMILRVFKAVDRSEAERAIARLGWVARHGV